MTNLKYYNIFLDGIDKSGKDLIAQYVIKLSDYKYIVNGRGIISQIAYNNLYLRDFNCAINQQKYNVNVFLDVLKEDWLIRCKVTNEPLIDFDKHRTAFFNAYNEFKKYKYPLQYFNTSMNSPYLIAEQIVDYTNNLNNILE